MIYKKGQAGLDFLMTYGWALLLIVLVVGALFALGIFDIGSFIGNRAAGFSNIGLKAWKLDTSGSFTAILSNRAGSNINITNVNATLNGQTINYSTVTNIQNGRDSSTISIGTFNNPGPSGSSYTIRVEIQYTDTATAFSYKDSGTVTGKVN